MRRAQKQRLIDFLNEYGELADESAAAEDNDFEDQVASAKEAEEIEGFVIALQGTPWREVASDA